MPGRFFAFALAAALAALPVRAEPTDELTSLRQETERLRQSLHELENRIQALEERKAAPAEPAFFVLQRKWSEIRPGTPQEHVEVLLGKPERVMRINGDLVWYYLYPDLGRGSVFFSAEGKVTAAQAPRLSWSW